VFIDLFLDQSAGTLYLHLLTIHPCIWTFPQSTENVSVPVRRAGSCSGRSISALQFVFTNWTALVLCIFLFQVKLVIVDSIAFHFRQDFDDYLLRSRLLNALAQTFNKLIARHNVAVSTLCIVLPKVGRVRGFKPLLVKGLVTCAPSKYVHIFYFRQLGPYNKRADKRTIRLMSTDKTKHKLTTMQDVQILSCLITAEKETSNGLRGSV